MGRNRDKRPVCTMCDYQHDPWEFCMWRCETHRGPIMKRHETCHQCESEDHERSYAISRLTDVGFTTEQAGLLHELYGQS